MEWGDPLGLAGRPSTRAQELKKKYGHLSVKERRDLIEQKSEANAERWVRDYESKLATENPGLNLHFVDKHGADTPLTPNLRQRSIDGSHPRTGSRTRRSRPQTSSQFKDWCTQRDIINEATTREARGLPKYNGVDRQGNPIVKGTNTQGVGHGFSPNRRDPSSPVFNDQLDNWVVRFDSMCWSIQIGYEPHGIVFRNI